MKIFFCPTFHVKFLIITRSILKQGDGKTLNIFFNLRFRPENAFLGAKLKFSYIAC